VPLLPRRSSKPGRALDAFPLRFFVESFIHEDEALAVGLMSRCGFSRSRSRASARIQARFASTSFHRMRISCLAMSTSLFDAPLDVITGHTAQSRLTQGLLNAARRQIANMKREVRATIIQARYVFPLSRSLKEVGRRILSRPHSFGPSAALQ